MDKELSEAKLAMDEAIEFFKKELKNVRTGRANSAMVEDLKVDYYGVPTPVVQMASISVQDARSIVIIPWSRDSLVQIEKAINESDLNVNPNNDGNSVRLNFPPLTEDRRKELVKLIGKKTEETRIRVRQAREEAWSEIQKIEKEGGMSEDDKFKKKDDLQKIVDQVNKQVEEIADKKSKEVMEV